MTRLELLKDERQIIRSLRCIGFAVKELALKYYEHEIECIEKYGSDNPEYEVMSNDRR